MKRKSIIAILLVAVIATAAVFVHRAAFARETTTYRFTSVERGDIEATVSATGTLRAVTTVAVGTQVSGQISELFVDFNDIVKKGQLLARIDPKLQQQAVTDAAASLERVRAQYLQAQREHNRNRELMSAGLVARSELESTDSSVDVARATVTSAQVALERAKQNLEYTNIYAPIDGVVVERNIDLGQTVAASLSAPQLFLIANDLADMQILANVGEGDIASIKEDQPVKFTVQAIQGRTFEGTVRQVRLQSATNENVVNYTVVVSVANPRKVLLPGMTARVEFLTNAAKDVLTVANAALRFKPEGAASATTTTTTTAGSATAPTARSGRSSRNGGQRPAGMNREGGARTRGGTLYVVDANGEPKAVKVRTGLSDGSTTEIRGEGLTAGMKVIAGTVQAQSADGETAKSPFASTTQQQQGGRRPGGF
ncbi:MAG TPA: efflux RND transporter periplasmic adaptor subunit [Thermoanaerobaculia bacterium]|nr:efflux RND transporter periplasmic adaptor subunit [Thermoanaerobaculia bacterium]